MKINYCFSLYLLGRVQCENHVTEYQDRGVAGWSRTLDLNSGGLWRKSSTLPLSVVTSPTPRARCVKSQPPTSYAAIVRQRNQLMGHVITCISNIVAILISYDPIVSSMQEQSRAGFTHFLSRSSLLFLACKYFFYVCRRVETIVLFQSQYLVQNWLKQQCRHSP